MINLTQDQILSAVRWLVTGLCGAAVTKGMMDASYVEPVVAFFLAAATLGWSLYIHNAPQTVKAAAKLDSQIEVQIPPSAIIKHPSLKKVVDDETHPQIVEVAER
jgi:hypothetical protein